MPGILGLPTIEGNTARGAIITSKTICAHASAVVDGERDHFLFRHCWQSEQDGKQGFRQKWLLKVSRRRRLMSSIPLLFRSCSMKTSLANDFAVVRLETKEGPFDYRNISARNLFFITVLNKFQKLAAGGKLQSLQIYINSKTIGL